MNLARRVIVPLDVSPIAPALGAVVHTLEGGTMGTRWCVKFNGPRQFDVARLHAAIQLELEVVVGQMSPWEADSDISRYNRAGPSSWHALPPEFAQVMACAMRVAADSRGAFDPTAGELVNLWGFGPPGRGSSPPPQGVSDDALTRSGWQRLCWDGGKLLQPGGVQLDLSAIAKGFGVDQLARCLNRHGFEHHLVEVGGELRGTGVRPDGQPWWVDVQMPPAAHGLGVTRIALHGLSVATSGDYLRGYFDDGAWRSHTIDPRTGVPIASGLASVSVVHAQCMEADALSTALTVLGVDEGMAFAREHGVAALFIRRDAEGWTELLSPALQALAQ